MPTLKEKFEKWFKSDKARFFTFQDKELLFYGFVTGYTLSVNEGENPPPKHSEGPPTAVQQGLPWFRCVECGVRWMPQYGGAPCRQCGGELQEVTQGK